MIEQIRNRQGLLLAMIGIGMPSWCPTTRFLPDGARKCPGRGGVVAKASAPSTTAWKSMSADDSDFQGINCKTRFGVT